MLKVVQEMQGCLSITEVAIAWLPIFGTFPFLIQPKIKPFKSLIHKSNQHIHKSTIHSQAWTLKNWWSKRFNFRHWFQSSDINLIKTGVKFLSREISWVDKKIKKMRDTFVFLDFAILCGGYFGYSLRHLFLQTSFIRQPNCSIYPIFRF